MKDSTATRKRWVHDETVNLPSGFLCDDDGYNLQLQLMVCSDIFYSWSEIINIGAKMARSIDNPPPPHLYITPSTLMII